MQIQKDFLNLIQKIGVSKTTFNVIQKWWEVKNIDWNPKIKKVHIQLKQLKIVPIKIINEVVAKAAQSQFKITFSWQGQIDWKEELINIQSYINHFLQHFEVPQIFTNFSVSYLSENILKIEIKDENTNLRLEQNKITKELVAFLNDYGITVTNVYFVFNMQNKNEKLKSESQAFFDPDQKEINLVIKNYLKKNPKSTSSMQINSGSKSFVEGRILNVESKMFGNQQRFEILIETEKRAQMVRFQKNIVTTDANSDTDFLKKGECLRFHGFFRNSDNKYFYFFAKKFEKIIRVFPRSDLAKDKRVELHVHTKMSALDGIGEIDDYLAYANYWNHKAIAITDHQNVHIFPECDHLIKKYPNLKVIFGCEFEFLSKPAKIINQKLEGLITNHKLLFFDIETTGLSAFFDEIIEFAAIIVQNGLILKKETFLIQCKKKISLKIHKFTHISQEEHQKKAITFKDAMKRIKNIFADHILIAHNADFDVSFINIAFQKVGLSKIKNPIIDTLNLSRCMDQKLRSHRLERLAKRYKIAYLKSKSHRAIYDTMILERLFEKMIIYHEIVSFQELWSNNNNLKIYKKLFPKHLIVLVKNKAGLRDLYYLISHTHTETLYQKPVLKKSDLEKIRSNFLVGSSCYNGEVFEAACFSDDEILIEKIQFYDYIEVQPLEVYKHLVVKEIITEEDLEKAVLRIIKFTKQLGKIIVATGDVHYLEPEHYFYRDIFVFNKQLGGGRHDLYDFSNRLKRSPPQYLRTTDEMLKSFDFLNDPKLAFEMVVTNTNLIADQIKKINCFNDSFIMPKFTDSEQILNDLISKKMLSKYGSQPNSDLKKRLDKELKQVIKASYSTIYLISYYLTEYSLKNNYLFGSRGSVGSSFLAYCLDITEVNPLLPHYLCNNCYYFEWNKQPNYFSGFDLPDKKCPKCESGLSKNGHEIAFESFLGLDSENVPDIDLNFSGEFQGQAQKFVFNLLNEKIGKNKTFWTGTVSTVAKQSAYGYYKNFSENFNTKSVEFSELQRILTYCSGVKKTTGQHPGGLMIIPNEKDILDFSPYNYPSNNKEGGNLTTHFDYHVLHNQLLKIDILGHDDPTGLKILQKMTNKNPKEINLSDKRIIQLFSDNAVLGLPEFGTIFVSRILTEVKIQSFADLIVISGLSHGKNVWESNARNLIKQDNFNLHDVISCRDDILLFLIKNNVNKSFAYQIMQKVKKGLMLSNIEERKLQEYKIPQWYIDSCKKIKYLFPKAHATAYVIMACRFAWFKIYYPHEFYATYFSIRCSVFDLKTILQGVKNIQKKYKQIQDKLQNPKKYNFPVSTKEKNLLPIYEVAIEMWEKGIELVNLNLNWSEETLFLVKKINGKKVIIPPFNVVDRLGIEFAKKIVAERTKTSFLNQEDFKMRTGINQAVFQNLVDLGLFQNLKKSNQNTFAFF